LSTVFIIRDDSPAQVSTTLLYNLTKVGSENSKFLLDPKPSYPF